jgi:micrococcal nuclease
LWVYRAALLRCVDGDTVDLQVDLGFRISFDLRGRLCGINAPEKRGADKVAGKAATAHLIKLCNRYALNGTEDFLTGLAELYVKTIKDEQGKYGRYIVELWGVNLDGEPVNINQQMLIDGHAVQY